MSEQRLLDELDTLNRTPWWLTPLPMEEPAFPPFGGSSYGVREAEGPISAATIHMRLEATQTRKRRMTLHMLICFALVLSFAAAFILGVEALLTSGAIYFLSGAAIALFLAAPSFVYGYAREEKRLTLYRLLAAHYDGA